MYTYSFDQWIAFFFIYCFFGWIFESTYVSLKQKHFVNRGFLRLPMLPLYGTGAVMMLWASLPVKNYIVLVFLVGIIAATALEYVTGFAMERLFKMRYWDYSGQRFQLQGYICLSSSIAWGFLTIFLTEVVHKPIELFVVSLHPAVKYTGMIIIGLFFMIDVVRSTKAALDLGTLLESMTKIKTEMEELQVQLALLKNETAVRVSELKTSATDKTMWAADELQQRIAATRNKHSELYTRLTTHKAYIFLNNPSASSRRFAEVFREIKENLNHRRK